MDALLKFVSEHPLILAVTAIGLTLCAMTAIVLQRIATNRKTGPFFPEVPASDVLYDEYTASGASCKNLFTRFGGANRCLRVRVTKDELWIHPTAQNFFPAPELDLAHRVKKARVTARRDSETANKKRVLVEFQDDNHIPHRFVLRLRDADAFLLALKTA